MFLFQLSDEASADKNTKKTPPKMTSLFFSSEETPSPQDIDKKEFTLPLPLPPSTDREIPEVIYLGALFFQSPSQWTLWVNGRRITSDEEVHHKLAKGLKIEEVSEHQVVFSWSFSPKSPSHQIILHPNQTYFIAAQETWEGDLRPEE